MNRALGTKKDSPRSGLSSYFFNCFLFFYDLEVLRTFVCKQRLICFDLARRSFDRKPCDFV